MNYQIMTPLNTLNFEKYELFKHTQGQMQFTFNLPLTDLGRDIIADILQTTFPNPFVIGICVYCEIVIHIEVEFAAKGVIQINSHGWGTKLLSAPMVA